MLAPEAEMTTLHEIKVHALNGKPADLCLYKGKVVLAVNLASR